MPHGILADLTLVVHAGFVLFVTIGAVAVVFRPRLALLHVPAVLYGAGIELVGWVCPLTPLEQSLRRSAGQAGYQGAFIEHYVGGLLYPDDWGSVRVGLGIALIAINLALYALVIARARRRSGGT